MGAKRRWRLFCTDRSETEKRSDYDWKMSAKLTRIARKIFASVDLKQKCTQDDPLQDGMPMACGEEIAK
ncbi:hypothetical protein AAAY25_00290 [Brotaphodocola catenula]|uniref:hypothetical protein n=1 Tax=Brotaphodocola catenula TaxID=2885361 RepID=UPI003025E04E